MAFCLACTCEEHGFLDCGEELETRPKRVTQR
jgi:hypothetical protein